MFKKTIKAVGNFTSRVVAKSKKAIALCLGLGLATSASAQSALEGFISTDATTGDPVVDPSKPVNMMKTVVVSSYSEWLTYAMIIVIVGLVLWIIFKRK
jgi:hypothetical protein